MADRLKSQLTHSSNRFNELDLSFSKYQTEQPVQLKTSVTPGGSPPLNPREAALLKQVTSLQHELELLRLKNQAPVAPAEAVKRRLSWTGAHGDDEGAVELDLTSLAVDDLALEGGEEEEKQRSEEAQRRTSKKLVFTARKPVSYRPDPSLSLTASTKSLTTSRKTNSKASSVTSSASKARQHSSRNKTNPTTRRSTRQGVANTTRKITKTSSRTAAGRDAHGNGGKKTRGVAQSTRVAHKSTRRRSVSKTNANTALVSRVADSVMDDLVDSLLPTPTLMTPSSPSPELAVEARTTEATDTTGKNDSNWAPTVYGPSRGRCDYSVGEYYDGAWLNSLRHGRGVYQWADGRRFEGIYIYIYNSDNQS